MSNYKQIMKLYTEEQVREAYLSGMYVTVSFEEVLQRLTTIELPSDEEIHKLSPHQIGDSNNSWDIGFHNGWEQGAKWMRDKIQGGNNEQR